MARNTAEGGKSIYGVPLGVLMLDARFARIPGDMGNALTWPFPVLYKIVKGASPERVVCHAAEGLLDSFVDAAKELVDQGAEALTTNCGFLSIYQKHLADAVQVPVLTSSMMQVPWVQAGLPSSQRVGIVTVNSAGLSPAHLTTIGIAEDTPVAGTENGKEFFRTLIKAEKNDLDVGLAREDIVSASLDLVQAHPEVGAIVLECTNMPPYAAAVRKATQRPVYDIYSLINWFHLGLRPKSFEGAIMDGI